MNARRTIVILTVVSVLILGAISVASSAATEAVICSSTASKIDKFGGHCSAIPSGKTANFGHRQIGSGVEVSVTFTNANTAEETKASSTYVLAGSLSGVASEIQCTELHALGTLINSGGQAFIEVGSFSHTGCVVTKPSGKGCVVKGGTFTSNKLAGESEGATVLKLKPASGETIATITIESCTVAALNHTFPLTGSLKATIQDATLTFTEAAVTEQNTLKFGGNKAGLGVSLTLKDALTGVGIAFT